MLLKIVGRWQRSHWKTKKSKIRKKKKQRQRKKITGTLLPENTGTVLAKRGITTSAKAKASRHRYRFYQGIL